MTENKITTYLLYAIGEIFLVVVGILIAVQIDDWNREQERQKSQKVYMNALKSEFEENQLRIAAAIKTNEANMHKVSDLIELIGDKVVDISVDSLSVLIIGVWGDEVQYRPKDGVINEIISSGKLELFGQDSLKILITAWNGDLLKIRFQEVNEVERIRQKLVDLSLEKINLRNIAYDMNLGDFDLVKSKSKISDSSLDLLESSYFENLLVQFAGTSYYLNNRYYPMRNFQDELIQKIEVAQNSY